MILDKMIKRGSTGKKILVIELWALRDQWEKEGTGKKTEGATSKVGKYGVPEDKKVSLRESGRMK